MLYKRKDKKKKVLAPTTQKLKELREKEVEGLNKPLTEKMLDEALKKIEKIGEE